MQLSDHASEDTLLLGLGLLLAGAGGRVGDGDLRRRLGRGQAEAGGECDCRLQAKQSQPSVLPQLAQGQGTAPSATETAVQNDYST